MEISIAPRAFLWDTPLMKVCLPFLVLLCTHFGHAQDKPKIPEDLLDDEVFRSESALNDYTVPSIAKVFNELDKIAPLAYDPKHLEIHEQRTTKKNRLALRLGTLIANGFIAVQTGNSDDVPKITTYINQYAKSLAAGDRVQKHGAALLEHAKAKDLDKLKQALAATQRDVELELVKLKDPDLSHLISLGGWLQALDSAALAVDKKYTPERALTLFREDVADYYAESIGSLNPSISSLPEFIKMRELLQGLRNAMVLEENAKPTAEQVKEVTKVSAELVALARK